MPDLVPMQGRSPGVHVSGVIRNLCLRLGHYEASDDSGPNQTRLELGCALEHAIIVRLQTYDPDRYIQPGELCKDDLHGTPDLVDLIDNAVIEIKLTWLSTKNGPDSTKFWKYWVQLMAYCWMWETSLGRLHVCHVNGNYKFGDPGGGPTYRVWERRFTRSELLENWRMLKTHGGVA